MVLLNKEHVTVWLVGERVRPHWCKDLRCTVGGCTEEVSRSIWMKAWWSVCVMSPAAVLWLTPVLLYQWKVLQQADAASPPLLFLFPSLSLCLSPFLQILHCFLITTLPSPFFPPLTHFSAAVRAGSSHSLSLLHLTSVLPCFLPFFLNLYRWGPKRTVTSITAGLHVRDNGSEPLLLALFDPAGHHAHTDTHLIPSMHMPLPLYQ